jgi:SAM-dependent methyltransferase
MKSLSAIMEDVTAYRLWQAPFAEKKLAPLLRRPDIARARSVLDVGCGPGTNTAHFAASDYLGIDWNADYIGYARRRHRREFVAADVRTYAPRAGTGFDFILVNSLLHHIDDSGTHELLSKLASLLTSEGHVHILDLVLPARWGVARSLAQLDRGRFARTLDSWKAIFQEHFDPVVLEPYPLGIFGLTLWNMVYFKGRRRP